ncbi:MAG: bifunctional DNA-formamidopyrimidine glycosylase/DNA-(apurinic or apyrimidinic site) lyase [Propionibacteriaceae bacterium]|jgi:formamidopyrimidine-DNA glycosylase|nr:bifunctional DNA-formamidopyrimidine glycosylase/DNA-(apurinic or apyrimidinic site) lyase [Propionibacteriaceae bacterium]
MPELPEVEVVRAGIAAVICGKTISEVCVYHPRSVRRHELGAADFEQTLRGRTFAEPKRRGKYLWLPFADGDALSAHLGMSGQFRVDEEGAQGLPELRHVRVELRFADSPMVLRFTDQRLFGGLWVSPEGAAGPVEISHIAKDLFDPQLDIEALAAKIISKHRAVKRLLLDQEIISGIGNIYADESLWRAKVHYLSNGADLNSKKVKELLFAARRVMSEALAAGGTSFDALYVNVAGESGYFERELAVYGREGEPCGRCGAQIAREPFMGRSSFLCPVCQVRPKPYAGSAMAAVRARKSPGGSQ